VSNGRSALSRHPRFCVGGRLTVEARDRKAEVRVAFSCVGEVQRHLGGRVGVCIVQEEHEDVDFWRVEDMIPVQCHGAGNQALHASLNLLVADHPSCLLTAHSSDF